MATCKPKITLRPQKLSDAKRLYEIVSVKNFPYSSKPKSLDQKIKQMKEMKIKEKKFGLNKNYAIILEGKLVGACKVKIDFHRPYIGEIGYFIDKDYWGRGIATESVKQLEKICFNKLKLTRIEIRMNQNNCPSEKVAIKAGYIKEGAFRKSFKQRGMFVDDFVYAKVK